MMSLISPSKAQKKLAENARAKRLQMALTQEGLANRSGVPVRTLRKFEQEGAISLASFLKLYMVLGGLDDIIAASASKQTAFASIDEVLSTPRAPTRKRGTRK
ncbi:helix-turn-helix domain-containing protein [Bowmanella denitrificans]|uniref:helix-turn-helix domain-containing protein n=1 Tax=Bowmanella denitrificans TaxID=366582 RepID=UPI001558C09F|nr:helix-turn-helix transcriptional regulator [Bowmanella denitrificans]